VGPSAEDSLVVGGWSSSSVAQGFKRFNHGSTRVCSSLQRLLLGLSAGGCAEVLLLVVLACSRLLAGEVLVCECQSGRCAKHYDGGVLANTVLWCVYTEACCWARCAHEACRMWGIPLKCWICWLRHDSTLACLLSEQQFAGLCLGTQMGTREC
jgi:hypothetical protein